MTNPSRALCLVALATATLTSACATISVGVDPFARQAGVPNGTRVMLHGGDSNIVHLQVYQNGATDPLRIVWVNDPTFGQALSNSMRQTVAEQAAQGQANALGSGSATYTTTERYSPAIFLKQKGTHNLKLVRSDGTQATVVTKGHVGLRYVVVDWLLFAPTFGTSILIDWATAKWKMYDAIELNQLFPQPTSH